MWVVHGRLEAHEGQAEPRRRDHMATDMERETSTQSRKRVGKGTDGAEDRRQAQARLKQS